MFGIFGMVEQLENNGKGAVHLGEAIAKNIDMLKPELDKEETKEDMQIFLPFLISPKVGLSVIACLNMLADHIESVDIKLLTGVV